jgi:putative FmdB family regulatory protein
MPFYQFACTHCGEFPLWRRLDERNLPAVCPNCQQAVARLISAPQLNLMPAARRIAHARNEKSRHEPGVKTRHHCGTGCNCGSGASGTRKSTRTVDLGKTGRFETARQSKRPWMLGH